MEKRLILAVVLSSLILLLWSFLTPKPVLRPAASPSVLMPVPTAPEPQKENSDGKKDMPGSLIKFSNEKLEVVFDEDKAEIKEAIFKKYRSYKLSLSEGLFSGGNFKKSNLTADSVTFRYLSSDKEITKRFIFFNSSYSIELHIEIKNLSNVPLNFSLPLTLGAIDFTTDPVRLRNFDFTVSTQDKLLHPNPHKENVYNNLKFIGLRDRYFCIITAPPTVTYSAFIKKEDNKKSVIGLNSEAIQVYPGQTAEQKFLIYLGPQETKLITGVNPEWAAIVHFGTFDIISQVLLKLLEIFHGIARNWGLAIIILSIAVYFLLYPLSLKQMRSMKEMQALQPRIEELRKEYKDNPQKLNKEIMELYREHKVNPLLG